MKTLLTRFGWMAAGGVALYALLTLASVVSGGPLDPPGPIGSTMKTLDDIPGSWHRLLTTTGADPCSTERFDCVMSGDAAVLDKETGLVWQRSASQTHSTWGSAAEFCVQNTVGGRRGWRLPTADELVSLGIPFAPGSMDLPPPNSPFTGFEGDGTQRYWTATDSALDSNFAFVVDPSTGFPTTHPKAGSAPIEERVVCVRGAQTSQSP